MGCLWTRVLIRQTHTRARAIHTQTYVHTHTHTLRDPYGVQVQVQPHSTGGKVGRSYPPVRWGGSHPVPGSRKSSLWGHAEFMKPCRKTPQSEASRTHSALNETQVYKIWVRRTKFWATSWPPGSLGQEVAREAPGRWRRGQAGRRPSRQSGARAPLPRREQEGSRPTFITRRQRD